MADINLRYRSTGYLLWSTLAIVLLVILLVAWFLGAFEAAAAERAAMQDSQSAAAAKTLTGLLDERKLDAVAARDPEATDRFVAALYFPGSQLLAVSATYSAPAALEQRIANGNYREAYMDLQGAGAREGRFFITDLQANGLHRTRQTGQPFDIVYRNGVDEAAYNGDWKGQKLTQSKYDERYATDDAQYARMLQALIAQLSAPVTRGAGR